MLVRGRPAVLGALLDAEGGWAAHWSLPFSSGVRGARLFLPYVSGAPVWAWGF